MCAVITSSDCCDGASPCCSIAISSCGPIPDPAKHEFCLCARLSDCSFYSNSQACIPGANIDTNQVTGPYVCINNNGKSWGGCRGVSCSEPGQSCASDKAGNDFCSIACASDSSCNNSGVACCNAACQDGGKCCGLCGS